MVNKNKIYNSTDSSEKLGYIINMKREQHKNKNTQSNKLNNQNDEYENAQDDIQDNTQEDVQMDETLDILADLIMEKLEKRINKKIEDKVDTEVKYTLEVELEKQLEEKLDGTSRNNIKTMDFERIENYNNMVDIQRQGFPCFMSESQEIFDDEYEKNVAISKEGELYITPSISNFSKNKKDYNFDNYVLISNVKQILDESGVKTSWLQERTQIPTSTLRSILNNEKAVSLENAYKISIVMDIPINRLFSYGKLKKVEE